MPEDEEFNEEDCEDDDEDLSLEDVWEAGVLISQQAIYALIKELKGLGGVPSDIHIIRDEAETRREIAQKLIARRRELQSEQEFTFMVNYQIPLAQLIYRGGFDEVDSAIPRARFKTPKGMPKTLVARLMFPSEPVPIDKFVAAIAQHGYRPADAKALVAFATKFPEAQKQHPVFALGSIGKDPEAGTPVALCATTDSDAKSCGRILMAEPVNVNIDPVDFALVVKDVTAENAGDND